MQQLAENSKGPPAEEEGEAETILIARAETELCMIILFSVPQKECLTTSDMREVIDTLWDYRAKWRLIGIQMGIKPGDLDAIGKHNDVDDALIDVTKQWLRNANPKPNRAKLAAIIESKCIAGEVTSTQGNNIT